MNKQHDATIIGSGPNGFAAAITLAKAGKQVALYEAKPTIGGGMRSAELTLPGFIHDICSAIHPLGIGSPFFRSLPLDQYGLKWVQPNVPLAHPFDDGTAILLERSIEETGNSFPDKRDAGAYEAILTPFVEGWDILADDVLAPLHFPRHPLQLANFGYYGIQSGEGFARRYFNSDKVRAFFAGLAAHSILPLNKSLTASFGLILAILGHKFGWPIAQGGSQSIASALAAQLVALGGEIITEKEVTVLQEIDTPLIFCDVTPKQLVKMGQDQFSSSYLERLKNYRYGPGVCKIDWALSSPIPWKAPECLRAGTVHLGGSLDEIVFSELQVWEGKHPEKPYVLLAQQSLFDPSRAPPGKQTAWGYCHVPNGSTMDMSHIIEQQIERFAPGFRDCILARNVKTAVEMQAYNANYVGGDINGGIQDIFQLYARPVMRTNPYETSKKGIYICSSSTPPGGGVHGMCGYHAAKSALSYCLGSR